MLTQKNEKEPLTVDELIDNILNSKSNNNTTTDSHETMSDFGLGNSKNRVDQTDDNFNPKDSYWEKFNDGNNQYRI